MIKLKRLKKIDLPFLSMCPKCYRVYYSKILGYCDCKGKGYIHMSYYDNLGDSIELLEELDVEMNKNEM